MFPDQKYNEFTLEDVTYEWLETCSDSKLLQKAIRLIEEDGDYFIDLKNAISTKLKDIIGPKATFDKNAVVDSETKKEVIKDLGEWQNQVEHKQKDQNLREAENLKIKGNDALRSGDFKEAILHYNSALKINPDNAIVLVNRSLAYFKLKDYKKSIEDASDAIKADPKYIKGYYRRAKANIELKSNHVAAYDFARILKIDKHNEEVMKELSSLKGKLSNAEKEDLEKFINSAEEIGSHPSEIDKKKDKKVKIVIEEGSEDEEEGVEGLAALRKEKNDIDRKMMDGAFEPSLDKYDTLLSKLQDNGQHEQLLIRLQILNNIAYCHKQLHHDRKVIEYTKKVVEACLEHRELRDKDEFKKLVFKALLREAQAHERLESDIKALEAYESVLCLYPFNQQAITARNKLKSICETHYSEDFDYKRLKDRVDNLFGSYIAPKAGTKDKPSINTELDARKSEAEPEKRNNQFKKHGSETTESYKITEADLSKAVSYKEKGNHLFKEKDILGAIKQYETAFKALLGTSSISEDIMKGLDERALKVVLDVLSNLSFAYFQSKQYRLGYELASTGLRFSHQQDKLKYRAALNGESFIKQLIEDAQKLVDKDTKLKIIDTADDVLKAVEAHSSYLYSLDQNDRMKTVAESCKVLFKILLNLRKETLAVSNEPQAKEETEPAQKPAPKKDIEVPKVEPRKDIEAPKEEQYQRAKKQPIKSDLIAKTENITKKAMDELIVDFRHPASVSQFETDINSFKDNYDKLIAYLCKQDLNNIRQLYANKQIEVKHLLRINAAVDHMGQLDNDVKEKLIGLFSAFTTSKNFKLTTKMLLKREKQQLLDLFEKIKRDDDDSILKLKAEYALNN